MARRASTSVLRAAVAASAIALGASEMRAGDASPPSGASSVGVETAPPILYRFSGARDDLLGHLVTVVHCSNTGSGSVELWVELHDFENSPIVIAQSTVPAGETRTFSTYDTALYSETLPLLDFGSDPLDQGHGVIRASSPSVICAAQLVEPLGTAASPSAEVVELPLSDTNGDLIGAVFSFALFADDFETGDYFKWSAHVP